MWPSRWSEPSWSRRTGVRWGWCSVISRCGEALLHNAVAAGVVVAAESGGVESVDDVAGGQSVLARYDFERAVVAGLAEPEVVEYRRGLRVARTDFPDGHTGTDQVVEAHSNPLVPHRVALADAGG